MDNQGGALAVLGVGDTVGVTMTMLCVLGDAFEKECMVDEVVSRMT